MKILNPHENNDVCIDEPVVVEDKGLVWPVHIPKLMSTVEALEHASRELIKKLEEGA